MSRRSRQESAAAAAAQIANQQAQSAGDGGWEPAPAVEPVAQAVQPKDRTDDPLPRPVLPRNDERDRLMQDVLEHRKAVLEQEVGQPVFEPAPTPEKQAEAAAPVVEKEAKQAVAPVAAVEPTAEASLEPEMVTLKVDGEEMKVPKAEVEADGGIAAAQIKRAMEKRLKAANDNLAQTRQALELVNRVVQGQQIPQAQMQQQRPASMEEIIKQAIPQIQLGSQEEAAAALQQVVMTALNSVPRVDPNQVYAYTNMKMQQTNAAERFKQEHGDLLANPMIARFAAIEEQGRLNMLSQQGRIPDWNQFYNQLGMELRAAVGKQNQPAGSTPSGGAPNTTAAPQRSDKEARKAEIVELPVAASARAQQPVEYKPKTREEVLNEMRRSRGIPTG